MMTLKVTKKQRFTFSSDIVFLKYNLWFKAWRFFNETSILVFAKLAISNSI